MTGVAAAQGSLSSALLPAPVRIRSVTRETSATFTWTLDLPEHAPSFTFAPGQFNMIYAFGVGEVAGWVTPRLGGIGPTTVAMLLRNTVIAAEVATQPKGERS